MNTSGLVNTGLAHVALSLKIKNSSAVQMFDGVLKCNCPSLIMCGKSHCICTLLHFNQCTEGSAAESRYFPTILHLPEDGEVRRSGNEQSEVNFEISQCVVLVFPKGHCSPTTQI